MGVTECLCTCLSVANAGAREWRGVRMNGVGGVHVGGWVCVGYEVLVGVRGGRVRCTVGWCASVRV